MLHISYLFKSLRGQEKKKKRVCFFSFVFERWSSISNVLTVMAELMAELDFFFFFYQITGLICQLAENPVIYLSFFSISSILTDGKVKAKIKSQTNLKKTTCFNIFGHDSWMWSDSLLGADMRGVLSHCVWLSALPPGLQSCCSLFKIVLFLLLEC